MDRVLRSSLLVVVAVGAGACNNEDLPDTEPTIGHATESPPATDGGTAANLCAPDYEPADPALFQCVGEGNGSFTNKAWAWIAA